MSLALKLTTYFKEAVIEMKKVIWPSKKQTINYTVIVIALSVGIAVFFAVVDNLLNQVLELII
ncbi:MAG: Preprotein translocase, SecE subunit [Candidatus Magasanikbacteria bacterium GW2011_GWA2_56_11]|uniref:Protein translocase subunit SecE n=1 Tax=Candidatus Magasanikbacteria bacterium GW2011_GWA2_56_11 TaxID=1619044 RepID=A0A0G1YHL9_9BACT|nr:MAG: Preprotein translocase, SecE subunit [Candidatus Magasanikbacteria bacterium GW2011_GWA2_56_11]